MLCISQFDLLVLSDILFITCLPMPLMKKQLGSQESLLGAGSFMFGGLCVAFGAYPTAPLFSPLMPDALRVSQLTTSKHRKEL